MPGSIAPGPTPMPGMFVSRPLRQHLSRLKSLPPREPRYPLRPIWVTVATMGVVTLLAAAWLLRDVEGGRTLVVDAAFETIRQWALPATCLFCALLISARAVHRWHLPVRRLRRAIGEVRRRETSTSDIAVGRFACPEIQALSNEVRWLAVELKKARQLASDLEREMRHQIADREDLYAQRLDRMLKKASRDPLSGLGNRGAFDEFFPAAVEEARKRAANLCVVMIDLDNFKQVNDQLGHVAGDRFISDVGDLIRGAVREKDAAFRYGGDEFVLLLSDVPDAAGRKSAQRLSALVDGLARSMSIEPKPGLSWGLSSLDSFPTADAEVLLKLADKDCYDRKHQRKSAGPVDRRVSDRRVA